MIKALLVMFAPEKTWEVIFRAQRSMVFVLGTHLLPLMVVGSVVEGWGLVHWGKWQGEVPHLVRFTPGQSVVFEALQFVFLLAIVLLNAGLLKSTSGTFQGRYTFNQAFKTIAYGMGPFFLFRFLNAFPEISPWISWLFGVLLTMSALYYGVPKIMQPDPAHAFGLYLVSCLLLLFTTGLLELLTAFCLQGSFPKLMTFISVAGARLPF